MEILFVILVTKSVDTSYQVLLAAIRKQETSLILKEDVLLVVN